MLALSLSFFSCNSDNKKADAIVITNEDIQDSLSAENIPIADDSSVVANQYEKIENNVNANSSVSEIENNKNISVSTSKDYTDNSTNSATANTSTTSAASNNQPRKVLKKATVQQMLTRDARLAKKMPLNRFGSYMTKRWNMYRGYGEVSYQDKTVEIKITDEELKIETPEGKFKREQDEMKLKTDAGKVKKETSN